MWWSNKGNARRSAMGQVVAHRGGIYKSNKTVEQQLSRVSGSGGGRERGNTIALLGRKGEEASGISREVKRGWQQERGTGKTEQKREMKHRRTATRPDRPVAQPAHVYLALLLRFFEVLIDELSRAFAETRSRCMRAADVF